LKEKFVPTFADGRSHVVSVTDPYGRSLGFPKEMELILWSIWKLKKIFMFTGKYRKDISICIHATLIRSFITLAYSSRHPAAKGIV
jgi:hypothetical protein